MSWRDRQNAKSADSDPRPAYPYFQWINAPSQIEPRPDRGGFGMVETQSVQLDTALPGAAAVKLHFGGGGIAQGYFTQTLTLIVVRYRFAFVRWDDALNREVRVPNGERVPHARGKVQAVVYLKTATGYTGPAMRCVRRMVCKARHTKVRRSGTSILWENLTRSESATAVCSCVAPSSTEPRNGAKTASMKKHAK